MTQVSIRNLSKTYPAGDGPAALNGLSLDIASGEMVALLGPSGCGKTTALKIIAGLIDPSAGDLQFDGAPVLPLSPDRRGAVMVFQNAMLFPYMTVAENIGFGLRMRRRPTREIALRVAELLDAVRLADYGPRKPSELSGGQAQRVALARALILQPKVLLLDEPLSSLDAHLRGDMRDLIRTLQRASGVTTVVVTHDQQEAVELADRVALLMEGRLHQFDVPEAFYRRPVSPEVARFFGGTNFVPGIVQGRLFHGPLGALTLDAPAPPGPGTLTFRPENVCLGPGAQNMLTATVSGRQFLGTLTRLGLKVGDVPIDMTLPPDQAAGIEPGQMLTIHLPGQALWVMPGSGPSCSS